MDFNEQIGKSSLESILAESHRRTCRDSIHSR